MFTIPISTLNLTAILELIGLNKLSWSILHIWATLNQDSEINIFKLEEKTKDKSGYQLSWNELTEISKKLEQVNDCTIVGFNVSKRLPDRNLSLEQLREVCDIVIECVDSTLWEVSTQDEELKKKLARRFS